MFGADMGHTAHQAEPRGPGDTLDIQLARSNRENSAGKKIYAVFCI